MRFFFRSKQFKIIVAVFLSVVTVSLVFGLLGRRLAPHTDVAAIITAPFKAAASAVSNKLNDFSSALSSGNKLMLKNAELSSQVAEFEDKTADYEQIKAENDFFKNYLGIKDANPDFEFCDAALIAKDNDDPYGSFTVNKGSLSGVSLYDPVITDEGLVGFVTQLGTTTCRVATVLSPEITLGAIDNRTNDSGIITGNIELAQNSKCRFANLSRSCGVAIGDYVVTSGEGIFPDGILIGKVDAIGNDVHNASIYADITPFVDLSEIRNVMIITSFDGQGGITVSKTD